MHYFEILAFSCVFSAVTATVESAALTHQSEELTTLQSELNDRSLESFKEPEVDDDEPSVEVNLRTDGPYNKDDTITSVSSNEIAINTKESSGETDSKNKESSENVEKKPIEPSEEIDTNTNVPSEETESHNEGSTESLEEVDTKTTASSEEIDGNEKGPNKGVGIKTNEVSEEVETKTDVSSKEIEGTDGNAKESSEGIENKEPSKESYITSDPSKLIKTTSATTRVTEGDFFPNQKVLGMNIGLYFVLEEIRRKLAFSGRVPTELLVKVLVLSSKIEEAGGEVIPLNQNMMKIVPNFLPSSFRFAVCSSATLTHLE